LFKFNKYGPNRCILKRCIWNFCALIFPKLAYIYMCLNRCPACKKFTFQTGTRLYNNIVISRRLYRTCWNNLATNLIISTRLLQDVHSSFQTCWKLGTSSANMHNLLLALLIVGRCVTRCEIFVKLLLLFLLLLYIAVIVACLIHDHTIVGYTMILWTWRKCSNKDGKQ
jgi:hypothetical protein